MSVYKRANWHSGLTYSRKCDQCKTVVTYTDEVLDFRPWFADGFVYCPTCEKPLRHDEKYAINANKEEAASEPQTTSPVPYCPNCGNKFNETDKFCPQCGTKR